MYRKKRVLALIPARAGSKGLPGKNALSFCGKPLIAWSIAQALSSKYIDKVMVSTESPVIASIARRYGANVPFLRPLFLASSSAKTTDVILHALSFFAKVGTIYDIVILLQPTSPLRNTTDIKQAIEKLSIKKTEAIVSVCKEEHNPLWSVTLNVNNKFGKFLKKDAEKNNRQNLPVFYRINGAVYAAFIDYFKQNKGFFGKSTFAYIMPPERSVDIDTEYDFMIASFLEKQASIVRKISII